MKMADDELISVIMPAYNAQETLACAVDSVLSQTYKKLELIIVDDCSKDDTLRIAQDYALADRRIKVLHNAQNSGASRTRHNAVEAASGKWIAFLDSDDAWVSDKLEKQVILQKKKNATLVFTGSAFMNAEGDPLDWTLHVPAEIRYRRLLKQNLISNSSVLVLKESYQKNEILGSNMHEDFACWLNLLRSGEVAYGIDEPLLIYRLSPNSKSGNKIKAMKMNWNAYRRAGLTPFEAAYYMCWYAVNGLIKYSHLRKEKTK